MIDLGQKKKRNEWIERGFDSCRSDTTLVELNINDEEKARNGKMISVIKSFCYNLHYIVTDFRFT